MADGVADQAVAPVAEAKLAAAHQAMLRAKDLQFDFAAIPEPPKPPGWLEWLVVESCRQRPSGPPSQESRGAKVVPA